MKSGNETYSSFVITATMLDKMSLHMQSEARHLRIVIHCKKNIVKLERK